MANAQGFALRSTPSPPRSGRTVQSRPYTQALRAALVTLALLVGSILQQGSASAATSAEQSAASWARSQTGSTAYQLQCLRFVYQAYISAGFSRSALDASSGYVAGANSYPIDQWNYWTSGHAPRGVLHQGYDSAPPVGAIIYFSNKLGHDYSHATISLGGGQQVSPDQSSVSGAQSVSTNSYRTMLGWWLPEGGSSASSQDFVGSIVQWSGDTKSQKTSWLVEPDGRRYWISSTAQYYCWRHLSAGDKGPQPSSVLDGVIPDSGSTANCPAINGPGAKDTLGTGQALMTDMGLWSLDGRYRLIFQGDRNLVLYGPSGAVWATNRYTGDFVIMQSDANLVGYNLWSQAAWSTGTGGLGGGAALVVQNDGNLVIYAGGRAVWDRYRGRLV